ncbi:MAG: nucleoside-diphosphate-sugar epimerase [Thermoproteota archaeon]|jgi:nucleoside-diphosphate-sugar epimerase
MDRNTDSLKNFNNNRLGFHARIVNNLSMKILVIGGTSFFGKVLVERLLLDKHDITVATRGNKKPFEGVEYKTVNRSDANTFNEIKDEAWDIIFDQICMTPEDAKISVVGFSKVKRYIFTSTCSVYLEYGIELKESQFDPYKYDLSTLPKAEGYAENKRQAEAVYFQQDKFPVVAIRFPIVLGQNDTSQRLNFHINKIKESKPIFIPNKNACMAFISQEDAADFLYWVACSDFSGPININSGVIAIGSIMDIIENKLNEKLDYAETKDDGDHSPYGIPETWSFCKKRSEKIGYSTKTNLPEYIKNLI